MRENLVANLRQVFARAGFALSDEPEVRALSFDFLARRDGELFVVKVLGNVDGLAEPVANELKALASALRGVAVVVGERSSSRGLEDGALYLRHGVAILTPTSLSEWVLDGTPPLVYAAPGGFYVTLDGEKLREIRRERAISLGQLADAAGVSRRAIAMYEEGMGAMVEVAERLEAFLDEALVLPVDPRRAPAERHEVVVDLDRLRAGLERDVLGAFAALGFRILPLTRGPVAAAARRDDEAVLAGFAGADASQTEARARALASLSEVAETHAAFIVERRTTRLAIEGTPVVSREEVNRFAEPADLVRLIEERRGRRR